MNGLGVEQFDQFFAELHDGKRPFPWQRNLAARVLGEGWPEVIDLPTASGKTACIDIALFALACSGTSPRRIFFVVDRRVVVNEAFLRMQRIADRLQHATTGVAKQVAEQFRNMTGDATIRPLSVFELRGGIYRDESWVRNPLQPAVIASTVDQVGSRLLFRGYGVTDHVLPVHAALIANDALILLDEAHCSKAFAETLSRIKDYRSERWAVEPLQATFGSVEMTAATPSRAPRAEPFRLTPEDRKPEQLGMRLHTPKKARMITEKGRADDLEKLARVLVQEAQKIADSAPNVRRIAIMVNRVATAKIVWRKLKETGKRCDLVIGRMRPIDRDDLNVGLEPLKSGKPRTVGEPPWFIVATQCLEAGADLDFDALVTECASMDALLQRFGRLDRLGEFAHGVGRIVALGGQIDGKRPDPVYGEALKQTWDWLSELATPTGGELDFGIEARESEPSTVPQFWNALEPLNREPLTIALPSAPILLPSHIDALVQTSPRPAVEPSIDLFLHGPQRGNPDVQVVWRSDLDETQPQFWKEIVAAAPPVSAEAMPVAIYAFTKWLSETQSGLNDSDLEGVPEDEDAVSTENAGKTVLIWRGDKSECTGDLRLLRPGDTIVLPVSYQGWDVLGHIPASAEFDCGDRAFFQTRRKIRLRLHPHVLARWPQLPALDQVRVLAETEGFLWRELQEALSAYEDQAPSEWPAWLKTGISQIVSKRAKAFLQTWYPDPIRALSVEGRARIRADASRIRADASMEEDAEGDDLSVGLEIPLPTHLDDVCLEVERLKPLITPALGQALETAARFHDCGKADPRFQALLHGGDHLAARFSPYLLAKGRFIPGDARQKRERSGLPDGFRHELISLVMVLSGPDLGPEQDLVLHLIASHHGRCRPLAPVVQDDAPEPLSFNGLHVTAKDRLEGAAHRLDNKVADRFWMLTRRFGWWGLAYLEALLRLSDWNASATEQEKKERAIE